MTFRHHLRAALIACVTGSNLAAGVHAQSADATGQQAVSEDELAARYPKPDAFLGEEMQPREIEAAARLIETLTDKIRTDYTDGTARRDAHPKAHGCVTATLDIEEDLPTDLTAGVFQPGASYRAVVRYSNGNPDPSRADAKGDTRGMAIKLFGVAGEKVMAAPGNPDVQDFILITSPFFFIDSAINYARFFEAVDDGGVANIAKIPFLLGARGSLHAAQMLRLKIANPLDPRYWSVVPYQLGLGDERQAVKYSVRPLEETGTVIPDNPDPDFLRAAMAKTLSAQPFRIEFMVQRKGDTDLSVENAVKEWPESVAPFQRVGILTIDRQDFDTPSRNAYCENQSYNPWHTLEAHKPLGMIGRTRKVVYEAISDLRHDMNNTEIPVGMPEGAE